MLRISNNVAVAHNEIDWQAVRAQGPGGQKVNKTNAAVHLRFDIGASSLPAVYKQRLLARAGSDQRITAAGLIVIKAQRQRSQEANLAEARQRLADLLASAGQTPRKRRPTRPSRSAKRKRTDDKTRRGRVKSLRGRPGRE